MTPKRRNVFPSPLRAVATSCAEGQTIRASSRPATTALILGWALPSRASSSTVRSRWSVPDREVGGRSERQTVSPRAKTNGPSSRSTSSLPPSTNVRKETQTPLTRLPGVGATMAVVTPERSARPRSAWRGSTASAARAWGSTKEAVSTAWPTAPTDENRSISPGQTTVSGPKRRIRWSWASAAGPRRLILPARMTTATFSSSVPSGCTTRPATSVSEGESSADRAVAQRPAGSATSSATTSATIRPKIRTVSGAIGLGGRPSSRGSDFGVTLSPLSWSRPVLGRPARRRCRPAGPCWRARGDVPTRARSRPAAPGASGLPGRLFAGCRPRLR